MQPVEIVKDLWWVGAVDWNNRDFHGYMLAPAGTTYNAFLLKDDVTVLFDTVKEGFGEEMLCSIARLTGGKGIDWLVVNHVEPDHAGALPQMIEALKPKKVICSPMGEKAIKTYFSCADWPLQVQADGTSLSTGKRTLIFLETRMLHWPDNMATYIPEDRVLVSSDAFGQNWATAERFADQVDEHDLERHLRTYFANIVLPYAEIARKVMCRVDEACRDVEYILPDHGLMYRGRKWIEWVNEKYQGYVEQKTRNKAVIAYDTMWHSTESMAMAIAEGLVEEGIEIRMMSVKANHHSAIMAELMDAKAFLVGSPTHNNGMLPFVAGLLRYVGGLKPKGKLAAAFGSYGWSGEAVKHIEEALTGMKMEIAAPGMRLINRPNHAQLKACKEFGQTVGKAILAANG